MSNWTDESRAKAVELYLAADPTPETNAEIIKEIAEELEESPNGTRMILMQAGVYKAASTKSGTSKAGSKASSTEGGSKRVSKESQIAELKSAIEAKGAEVDEDILSKLTGKAAAYFTTVLKK
jgi:transposase-like protein